MLIKTDIEKLRKWFLREQRDLPWRILRTPYAIWVSEMMLQQTQVSVVIPYFEKWITLFPSIADLAKAPIEDVLKAWEGLGYYSRAHYLHKGAIQIMQEHSGEFPRDYDALKKIKGLGEYTIGAILSFAFHQKISAVDANVIRVLSRYFLIEENIGKTSTLRKIKNYATELLPEKEPWVINEALIELGATICMRTPQCHRCPMNEGCRAYNTQKTDLIPYKPTRPSTIFLQRAVAIISCQGFFLIKRPKKGIMSSLCEFPYIEISSDGIAITALQEHMERHFGLPLVHQETLQNISHRFTRYRVNLFPIRFKSTFSSLPTLPEEHHWISHSDIVKYAFCSGHRQLLHACLSTQ
jgi:A/G-specific adenine glycosylase